jgi:transcriptional regulator with XRE-family HTH domain
MYGDGDRRATARKRVAHNLRARRVALELSQEELASRADLHRTYIGSIERGERNVSVDNLDRLAFALGLDVMLLLSPVGE